MPDERECAHCQRNISGYLLDKAKHDLGNWSQPPVHMLCPTLDLSIVRTRYSWDLFEQLGYRHRAYAITLKFHSI
jgi:hypothetical protein